MVVAKNVKLHIFVFVIVVSCVYAKTRHSHHNKEIRNMENEDAFASMFKCTKNQFTMFIEYNNANVFWLVAYPQLYRAPYTTFFTYSTHKNIVGDIPKRKCSKNTNKIHTEAKTFSILLYKCRNSWAKKLCGNIGCATAVSSLFVFLFMFFLLKYLHIFMK